MFYVDFLSVSLRMKAGVSLCSGEKRNASLCSVRERKMSRLRLSWEGPGMRGDEVGASQGIIS